MKLRILSEADVRSVIDMDTAITLQAEAFAILAAGQSIQGLRSFALSEEPPGVAVFNPAFLIGGAGYGIKVVSDFYRNEDLGVARLSSLVTLFDGRTGHPRTVMEGGYLTDVRTGAGTGLAARYLARADSAVVAVIGAGRVARNQLEALARTCTLERVIVATRTEARGRAFVDWARAHGAGIPSAIELVGSSAEAVGKADVVVAATTSASPVIAGSDLRPGTFVVSAGAHDPASREVDSEVIARAAKRVIDSRADSLANVGDFVIPMAEGIIGAGDVAEIAEIVAGTRKGRENAEEITYYKSLGVPIQDLVTAQYIEARAMERGIGTTIDIGGDHD